MADGEYTTRRRPGAGRCLAGCLWEKGHPGAVCGLANPLALPYIPRNIRGEVIQRITFLEKKREVVKADLLVKFEDQDWRGCQDCGSDLRDIDSELKGLRL